ncbi:probable WRKY transcription factor 4 isoform X2 [Manihot esculenta]|uniref:Uncharacterized protein n=1 Tax=Manihot esculenta TaxID=3983 RepID=A0ACC8E939_MANES|nr:probable WRKY transcription factor 4 isoform X2 [Manihot esculenta]OAY61699.2 hypothetical protein MANES_01G100400v8 [Manihot esculenta]
MAGKQVSSATKPAPPPPARPTISLPPRPSMDTLFTGGLSPGPMTLVSSFFSDNYPDSDCRSFSQLLAGAMASPIARPAFFTDISVPNNNNTSSVKQDGAENSSNLGFKQSRPVNLVVAPSPFFTVPPGLSPSGLLNSPGFFSPPQSPFGMSHQQALAQVTAQAAVAAQSHMHLQAQYQPAPVAASTEILMPHPSFTTGEASQQQQMLPSTSEPPSSMAESSGLSHSDRNQQPPIPVDKPSDDGYNWRKYGQKPIKGCECPRSYYKCTHLNCLVKKKVGRSSDGQITEIIYKGLHNHEQPQPNKRAKDNSDINGVPGREQESTQVDPIELSGSSDSEEAADGARRAEEGDDDEPNPKRRHTDVEKSEAALPHKTVTEPKIIVQTRSEVDLLDDGYRWRKYGQKVVKGNPHPRSYYKCTSAGCNVRKHVERAAADPKAVVTTYEGKHNHDIPAARNSSHNTANKNAPQLKPQKVVADKHPLLKGMDFGNSDQRPVLLRLKEEEIAV